MATASHEPDHTPARVAIIGGGLAGLAAASVLAEAGLDVELFEGRRQLGGRAASFFDERAREWIDHCQHVSMGCCMNLADFFQRAGASVLFRRDRVLHWIAPNGRRFDMSAQRLLPAPLHLAPGLWRLKFLTLGERLGIARALLALARTPADKLPQGATIADWLERRKQSAAATAGFWHPVLISALADTLDRISYKAARTVFVDGFMANRASYVVEVPRVSLTELYDQHIGAWLTECGVKLHRQSHVRSLHVTGEHIDSLSMGDGSEQQFDRYIIAVPWHQIGGILPSGRGRSLVEQATALEPSPITAVHLWFDRPIMDLPHAVLPGRTSQWIFHRAASDDTRRPAHYYQVVISGSRSLAELDRSAITSDVCQELADIWPAAAAAELLRSRVVTDRNAVFSPRPGHDAARPAATTNIANLFLAGDWTATGWPATMESAVRSGYRAAELLLASVGQPAECVIPERPREWLARLLIRDEKRATD